MSDRDRPDMRRDDEDSRLVSLSEPRVDDLESLMKRALDDHLLTTLLSESDRHLVTEVDPEPSAEVDDADPRLDADEECRAADALDALADVDGSIDPALWSLIRQSWRRGASPFGDTVH